MTQMCLWVVAFLFRFICLLFLHLRTITNSMSLFINDVHECLFSDVFQRLCEKRAVCEREEQSMYVCVKMMCSGHWNGMSKSGILTTIGSRCSESKCCNEFPFLAYFSHHCASSSFSRSPCVSVWSRKNKNKWVIEGSLFLRPTKARKAVLKPVKECRWSVDRPFVLDGLAPNHLFQSDCRQPAFLLRFFRLPFKNSSQTTSQPVLSLLPVHISSSVASSSKDMGIHSLSLLILILLQASSSSPDSSHRTKEYTLTYTHRDANRLPVDRLVLETVKEFWLEIFSLLRLRMLLLLHCYSSNRSRGGKNEQSSDCQSICTFLPFHLHPSFSPLLPLEQSPRFPCFIALCNIFSLPSSTCDSHYTTTPSIHASHSLRLASHLEREGRMWETGKKGVET